MGRDPTGEWPSGVYGTIGCILKVVLLGLRVGFALLGVFLNPFASIWDAMAWYVINGMFAGLSVATTAYVLGGYVHSLWDFAKFSAGASWLAIKGYWIKTQSWWSRAFILMGIAASFAVWPAKVVMVALAITSGIYDLWASGCLW